LDRKNKNKDMKGEIGKLYKLCRKFVQTKVSFFPTKKKTLKKTPSKKKKSKKTQEHYEAWAI